MENPSPNADNQLNWRRSSGVWPIAESMMSSAVVALAFASVSASVPLSAESEGDGRTTPGETFWLTCFSIFGDLESIISSLCSTNYQWASIFFVEQTSE